MFANSMAQSAYSAATTELSAPRTAEYDAFARITRALKRADDLSARVSALHDNRRLWNVLAADVADSDNALPDSLRARIFYLAEFTRQHTTRVLHSEANADVLVEINTAIMKGLRSPSLAGT